MIKILSIDQSLNCSGYCVVELNDKNDDFILIKHGFYKPKSTKSEEKILENCLFFNDLIKTEKIELVLLENIQAQKSLNTFKVLAMLLGALLEVIDLNHCDYMIIPPATWRKILKVKRGTKRKELKQLSKKFVLNKFGLDVIDDVSDAIVMMCYFIENQFKEENDGSFYNNCRSCINDKNLA